MKLSVAGLSPGFILFNLNGSVCYFIYNLLLLSPHFTWVQDRFKQLHGVNTIPVQWSDFAFAAHGLLIAVTLLAQYIVWRQKSNVPLGNVVLLLAFWALAGFGFMSSLFGSLELIYVVQGLGLAKLFFTATKYLPQVPTLFTCIVITLQDNSQPDEP